MTSFATTDRTPAETPPQRLRTIFLLSPASCRGRRASILLSPRAAFPLALRLRSEGVPLGQAFAFLSGLYFRGKLAYAEAFARRRAGDGGVWVITPCRGLVAHSQAVTADVLHEFAEVDVSLDEPRYCEPLQRDVERLAASLTRAERVVLLGSIASKKYVDILLATLGERLLFPADFIGRGDMSRGGLMLRSVDEGRPLDYVPVAGTMRRGPRPPRLAPRRRRPAVVAGI